ncbi:MAG: AbrB/MazE/SpoVT family DNA-binding domain-containing protein [bacterium]|nr:AbrB/MazE/SpoVT family DNA-binding domain-containing protein [bacterium]
MKILLSQPNAKGQIVIPHAIRKKLNITPDSHLTMIVRDKGFYVYPVHTVIHEAQLENFYSQILKKTKGSWSGEANEQLDKKKRKELELASSKKRKKAW